MHRVMALASARHLTVQFHTGLFEGSGNILSNGNPELLSNLFIAYPDVDFDLFPSVSYPLSVDGLRAGENVPECLCRYVLGPYDFTLGQRRGTTRFS